MNPKLYRVYRWINANEGRIMTAWWYALALAVTLTIILLPSLP